MLRQDGRQALAAALPKESKSPEKRKSVGWRKQHETCEMASGPANIPEFGTVKEPDGFKALYAMDAYQHVKPNAYPAVLLTAGVNDPRVAPWQATKMTARLQALDHQRKAGALARGLRCGAWRWLDQVPTRQRASRRTVLFVLAVWRVGLPTYKMTTLGTNG